MSEIEKKPLVSLDIDKMLQNINDSKEITEPSSPAEQQEEGSLAVTDEAEQKTDSDTQEQEAVSAEDSNTNVSDLWSDFLSTCNDYGVRVKVTDRKPYWIDDDIVDTLKSCDINKTAVVNVINAMLRTFIKYNKDGLRHYIKEKNMLI